MTYKVRPSPFLSGDSQRADRAKKECVRAKIWIKFLWGLLLLGFLLGLFLLDEEDKMCVVESSIVYDSRLAELIDQH